MHTALSLCGIIKFIVYGTVCSSTVVHSFLCVKEFYFIFKKTFSKNLKLSRESQGISIDWVKLEWTDARFLTNSTETSTVEL